MTELMVLSIVLVSVLAFIIFLMFFFITQVMKEFSLIMRNQYEGYGGGSDKDVKKS